MLGSLVPWRKKSLYSTPGRFSRMMGDMEGEFENLMEKFWGEDGGWMKAEGYVPTTDVVETENRFEVTVDLPGLKPEEVQVELKNGELWIFGKREEEKEEKGKTYHRIERRHGEFRRVLPLPGTISEEQIEARVEDGVLRVTVPKTEEAKTKHIKVKS